MTAPTISYGHGEFNDNWTDLSTAYTYSDGDSTGTATVDSNRDLDINLATFVAGNNASVVNTDNWTVSTTIYKKALYRYKTTGSAQAILAFAYAGSATTYTAAATSSTWKTASVTLTASDTLQKVYLAATTGTGHVYYDFLLICKGTFTFPQYTKLAWSMKNRYNNTQVPSKVGRRKAWIGADETIVTIDGNIDSQRSGWKRTSDVLPAEVLEDIHHNASSEPWQWLTTDRGQFKAVLENLDIYEDPEQPYLGAYNAVFSEYSMKNLSTYTLSERLGLADL